jgi:hypothetical protein
MALELAQHGILVNAIAPGPIATEKNEELYKLPEFASSLSRVPLGRPGTPAEIASVALFLASDGDDGHPSPSPNREWIHLGIKEPHSQSRAHRATAPPRPRSSGAPRRTTTNPVADPG